MARNSSIDRLPAAIREKIGQLRQAGKTIDEILEKLKELDVDVSRSALGRHCKQLEEVSKSIRQSRIVAEAQRTSATRAKTRSVRSILS